jgi:phage terminase small subunit
MTSPVAPGSAPLKNAKRERFVQEYRIDLNGKQAAIRAGYSPRSAAVTASQILTDPNVSARVRHLLAGRTQRTELTVEWVRERLIDVAERCLEPVPVRDRTGAVVPGEWMCDVKGATPALGLLAKHLGMLIERVEHTGKDGGPIEVNTAEVRDRLADRIARLAASN